MTAPLTPAEHKKIVHCLEMTRSPHEGEVINAVRAAARILGDRRWSEVWPTAIAQATPGAAGQSTWRAPEPPSWPRPSWSDLASFCARRAEHLDAWETSFVNDLLRRAGSQLTAKQLLKLQQIAERIRRVEGSSF